MTGQHMETHKCAFSHTLLGEAFGCSRVRFVTQRDGPHATCADHDAAQRCAALFQALKTAALPVFDVPDDLAQMPHSVPVKIQFGGLLGLQQALHPELPEHVADVDALIREAETHYGGCERIPCADFTAAMTAYKVKRRGGR